MFLIFLSLQNCVEIRKSYKLIATGETTTPVQIKEQQPVILSESDKNKTTSISNIETENFSQGLVQENIVVTGPDQQVKNSALIRQSIASCVGEKAIPTTKDMFLLSATKPPPGKVPFLQGEPNDGTDIIQREENNLYQNKVPMRGQAATYSLTLSYLGALGTVANVVAHNCDFTSTTSPCQCKTEQNALDFLKKCLPGLADSKLTVAAKQMSELCSSGKDAQEQEINSRKAIATALGSGVFALAR